MEPQPAGTTVRRPMNAFLIFCKKHRSTVRERHPHLDNRSVTRILGELWANMGTEEKAAYVDLAKQYKDAFMKAHPDFKWYTPHEKTTTSNTKPSTRPSNAKMVYTGQKPRALGEAITPGKLADPSNMGGLSLLLMAGQHLKSNKDEKEEEMKVKVSSHDNDDTPQSPPALPNSALLQLAEMCSHELASESQDSSDSGKELQQKPANDNTRSSHMTNVTPSQTLGWAQPPIHPHAVVNLKEKQQLAGKFGNSQPSWSQKQISDQENNNYVAAKIGFQKSKPLDTSQNFPTKLRSPVESKQKEFKAVPPLSNQKTKGKSENQIESIKTAKLANQISAQLSVEGAPSGRAVMERIIETLFTTELGKSLSNKETKESPAKSSALTDNVTTTNLQQVFENKSNGGTGSFQNTAKCKGQIMNANGGGKQVPKKTKKPVPDVADMDVCKTEESKVKKEDIRILPENNQQKCAAKPRWTQILCKGTEKSNSALKGPVHKKERKPIYESAPGRIQFKCDAPIISDKEKAMKIYDFDESVESPEMEIDVGVKPEVSKLDKEEKMEVDVSPEATIGEEELKVEGEEEEEKMELDEEDAQKNFAEGPQGRRTSQRSNRGRRYQELLSQGLLHPGKEKSTIKKTWAVPSTDSSSSEEEKKVHVSEDEDFRPSIAMIRRVRKRTVSETDKGRLVPSFPLGKKYKTGEFDLDAHIADLPPCHFGMLNKKKSKVRHHSESSRLTAKVSHDLLPFSLPSPTHTEVRPPQPTGPLPLVGSQKRKARKSSITHLVLPSGEVAKTTTPSKETKASMEKSQSSSNKAPPTSARTDTANIHTLSEPGTAARYSKMVPAAPPAAVADATASTTAASIGSATAALATVSVHS